MVVVGLLGRRHRRDRQHRVDDQVDRDHVQHTLGDPGELRQIAATERQDDRVGHLEPLDPPRERLHVGALDDRGANDRQAQAVFGGDLFDAALAQRLGERVIVRPAHRLRASAPVLDEPLLDPGVTAFLGVGRDRLRAGALVFLLGGGHERVEHLRAPGRFFRFAARGQRILEFRAPVDAVLQRAFGDHALGHAGDVRGRGVDDVRAAAARVDRFVQVQRAQNVGTEPLIDRRVERNGRAAVNDDVDVIRELGQIAGEVALEHLDVLEDPGHTLFALALAQAIEARALQHVGQTVAAGRAELGPDEHDRARLGAVVEEAFEQGLPEEPGHAGHEDAFSCELLRDHVPRGPLSSLPNGR